MEIIQKSLPSIITWQNILPLAYLLLALTTKYYICLFFTVKHYYILYLDPHTCNYWPFLEPTNFIFYGIAGAAVGYSWHWFTTMRYKNHIRDWAIHRRKKVEKLIEKRQIIGDYQKISSIQL